MKRLFTGPSWRLLALRLVDASGPRHLRARRRAFVHERVLRLRRLRYLLLDRLIPSRRRALATRACALAALRTELEDGAIASPAGPEGTLYESPAAQRLDGLRIGIFIPSFLRGQGGAEKVAGQLADVAAYAGARVDVLCREPSGDTQPYALDGAVRIHLLNEHDDGALLRLRARHYDLVICFGMAHFYRRIPHIARLVDAPFVIQECTNPELLTCQLLQLTDACSAAEAAALRQAVLAHAAGIRLTSPCYLASLAEPVWPFAHAFYNAFRLPQLQATRSLRSRKIICVGGLKNANKNGLVALNAFLVFAARHAGWQLVFYGENAYAGELARTLRAHPGADVRDAGVVRDASAIYADAHALIIPSFEEGLPNVVVEAFSFGIPCIGFADCAAVAHLVRNGETGILVERGDSLGIPRALEQLVDEATYRTLADGARKFATRHFDIATWSRNWLSLIRHAVDGCDSTGSPRPPIAFHPAAPSSSAWRELLESHRPVG